jgi:multiple sugar transport system permease protein
MNTLIRSKKQRLALTNALIFALLTLGAIIMIVPLIWMVTTSLKTKLEVFEIPPVWIPANPQWGNYVKVWSMGPLLQGFLNSIFISFTVVIIGTITSSLAAYSFAKLKFPHKETIFLALLGTMMIPFAITLIPTFVLYTKIGWIDTWYPLIIPGLFGNVSMIFFLRQYMAGIPTSLIEAAVIDGAGYFKIYWQVILPLARPAVAAQGILWFMGAWNDYFAPSIYINTPEKLPLQVVIQSFNAYYAIQTDYAGIMAASVLSLIPILLVFTIFQKQIISSVATTGLK